MTKKSLKRNKSFFSPLILPLLQEKFLDEFRTANPKMPGTLVREILQESKCSTEAQKNGSGELLKKPER
jgi:hypothetical protein